MVVGMIPLTDGTGGSMRADRFLSVMAAVVATLAMALAVVPSEAQTPTAQARSQHRPARVTVHKRTFLDPGTETRTHAEHYTDYYHSPADGFDVMRNSTLFNSGYGLPFFHDREPMPNCLDLPGYCRP
jgi:hypothetical protein